jgi:hypothetical protein
MANQEGKLTMIGETEKALHTPVPGTPIHDELLNRFANLVQSSENIGALKERIAITTYLQELLQTAPKGSLNTLQKLHDWIVAR